MRYSRYRLDFEEINRRALSHANCLLADWLPDGKRRGLEWVARNPRRTDQSIGSFKINVQTGAWADFAADAKGWGLISLLAYLRDLSPFEAAVMLHDFLGGRSL